MAVIDFPYQYQEGDIDPFAASYINSYRKSGWINLIALPYGKQSPPPAKYTGRNAQAPTKEQYKQWVQESRAGAEAALQGDRKAGPYNVAIVHGPDTISIDVDDYAYLDKKSGTEKRKNGSKQLKKLEEQLGKLPATWISSARGSVGDYSSGQRFFRLKPEHQSLAFTDKPGDSIEIVRGGHRYSVVWPSFNARVAKRYLWWQRIPLSYGEHVWREFDGHPTKKELPYLPDKWVEFLTNGFQEKHEVRKFDAGTFNDLDIQEWLDDRAKNGMHDSYADMGEGVELPACRKMADTLAKATDELPGGAHDALTKHLFAGMSLAHEGHSGIKDFLKEFHDAFVDEVQGRRDGGRSTAESEWFRSFMGCFERVRAREDPMGASCPCYRGGSQEFSGILSERDPADYDRSDDGNAEHLLDLAGGKMKWITEWKSWAVWNADQQIWIADTDNLSVSFARAVGVNCQNRADEMIRFAREEMEVGPEQDEMLDKGKKLRKWGTTSRNSGRITGMIRVSQSYPNVTMSAMEFDANPSILVVQNGTIELSPKRTGALDADNQENPIQLRETRMDDYCTQNTGIEYVPWQEIRTGGSGAALVRAKSYVEDYLNVFLPDPILRRYTQKVLGYGLYGANPERKIVFLHGKTSTGKSTIISAISGALGSYNSNFNLSLLRDKQDEGPRAELMHTLGKRIITSSETGSEWHLHADMIKRVTGGSDALSGRRLHSNVIIERIPAFTPYVACNRPPTIEAADSALWRRLLVLPFDQQVGVEGGVIGAMESVQKSGLDVFMSTDLGCRMVWLSWLLEGYAMWAREGLSDAPEVVIRRTNSFKTGVSDFHAFIAHAIYDGPEARSEVLPLRRVFDYYESWCWDNRIPERHRLTFLSFSRKLKDNGFNIVKKYARRGDDGYDPANRNQIVYIRGIKLNGSPPEGTKFNMQSFEDQFSDE